ncbi:MAG: ATP-grasp domain-containing protein [Myxococcota bacterium]|nr:ATP-grasp domain-containing protein [Myxococcota bacterium]
MRRSGSARPNVFVIGLDDAHRADLESIPRPERYRFHALLETDEVVGRQECDVEALLDRAREVLAGFEGSVDAILAHWDFPVSVMAPILCAEHGLPSPSLESVLRCQHKYWSRVEQRAVVPEATPDFCAVDPFADRPIEQLRLDFPFWIKPVIGYGSVLGFRVEDREDFDHAIEEARARIHRLGEPFDQVLRRVERPPEVRDVGGCHLIAEGLVQGREIAPEGHVHRGRFAAHGLIDMVRDDRGESFERYEYPAQVEEAVARRVFEASEKVLGRIGFDDGCFNIEFFFDEDRDRLWMVEINPRISQSHSKLFEKVDGASNHEVAVHVALGEPPRFEHGRGPFRHAAKFLHRRRGKEDAEVVSVPDEEDLAALRERQPGTWVHVLVEPGMRLSELTDQDAYSYVLAELAIGADSRQELEEKYREAVDLLPFELEPCEP